jgi:5'-nucleotidase
MRKTPIFLIAVFVASCAQAPKTPSLSNPVPSSAFRSKDPLQITIAVVGINDFHGSLLPRERKLPDGTVIRSGGAAVLSAMIARLREEMTGNVLVVDAGDEWQGTLESNSSKGATVVDFFNQLGVRAAAVGNHEFDFTVANLKKRAQGAKYSYVAANIREKKTGKRIRWKNVLPSTLVEVGGIRFGVIGASTIQTPSTTRYDYVKHLRFVDPEPEVRAEAARLRKAGAQAVLLTAHAGTECRKSPRLREWAFWDASYGSEGCDREQEIHRLADRLTSTQLDGIVAGHTHQVLHHFISGIPVIEAEAYNQYFNIIYYTFDRKSGKLLPELTRIEGLIPICAEFFEGTSHCDAKTFSARSSGSPAVPARVPAVFHGKEIVPDPRIEAWLRPIREVTDQYRKQVVGQTEMPLTIFRDRESSLSNLVADVLRERGHADFGLANFGGIRTSLDSGAITADDLFKAFPFDNLLWVVRITGRELKDLLRIATSGAHGLIGVSGLKIVMKGFDQDAPQEDLNGNGKLEGWETRRLISIKTSDGREIQDQKMYTLATFDYLLTGGDDLGWVTSRIPKSRISSEFGAYCRDLVSDHLRKSGTVNTRDHPLVDPDHPRIRFE